MKDRTENSTDPQEDYPITLTNGEEVWQKGSGTELNNEHLQTAVPKRPLAIGLSMEESNLIIKILQKEVAQNVRFNQPYALEVAKILQKYNYSVRHAKEVSSRKNTEQKKGKVSCHWIQ